MTVGGTLPGVCTHPAPRCINPYEFVRKYQCDTCHGVMMCACDREFGERFLAHQLRRARDRESGLDVPVSVGFLPGICRECRGLPAEPCPRAEIYGHTSKVQRYYWREIYFETIRRFADWASVQGYADRRVARREHSDRYEAIRREVIDEIKANHARSPKYTYAETPGADILARHNVEIVNLDATYIDRGNARQIVTSCGTFDAPEAAAAAHFESLGFKTLSCESEPFHALFGVYMWLLIQDPDDLLLNIRGFGDRDAYDAGRRSKMIWTSLPTDFGFPGYGQRRAEAITQHLAALDPDRMWLFDYWRKPSSDLRQYLWAHRENALATARVLAGC